MFLKPMQNQILIVTASHLSPSVRKKSFQLSSLTLWLLKNKSFNKNQ